MIVSFRLILFRRALVRTAGMQFPRTGRDGAGGLVSLPFPLDAVPDSGPAPNNRATLLRNILSFLVPGVNGRGTVALDSSAYNIPSFVTVELGDSDLSVHVSASVTVSISTHNGTTTHTLIANTLTVMI